jgi:hypothetical protein
MSLFEQVIGDGNLIMGACHIAHDCKIGNNNIFANSTLLAGHVEVEVSSMKTEISYTINKISFVNYVLCTALLSLLKLFICRIMFTLLVRLLFTNSVTLARSLFSVVVPW